MKKIALISNTLPPNKNGQALMIKQLFENIDSKDYCFISRPIFSEISTEKKIKKLNCNYYYIKPFIFIKKTSSKLIKILSLSLFLFEIYSVSKKIEKILKKESVDTVIACSGSLVDFPAAWFASKKLKLDFYPYLFDHYKYQQKFKILRLFAGFFEKKIIKDSTKVIMPNEKAYELYKEEYGVKGIIIHNPCNSSKYKLSPKEKIINTNDVIHIVYTGDVYDAQIDAFKNLVSAVNILKQKNLNIKINVYVNENSKMFILNNIKNIEDTIIFHNYVNSSEIPKIQIGADILFLPLSFHSSYPIELINTSAPGKTGEYLASGRPILVHAPKNSFLSWYFKKHKCGAVVDMYNPQKLAETLENLITNKQLQSEYIKNAKKRAKIDFDLNKIQKKFIKLFE